MDTRAAAPAPTAPRTAIPRPPEPQGPLAALRREIRACRACPLAHHRRRACPGEGPERAAIAFVGEAPGYEEDRQGRPFVGPAGRLLTELLEQAGISRRRVYITNAVKCLPPKRGGSAEPAPEALAACRPFLLREIELVRPAVLVALGRTATQALLGTAIPMARARGRVFASQGRWIYPMYHPSYLLRSSDPLARRTFEDDLRGLARLLRVHAATLRPGWSIQVVPWLYRSTPTAHTPSPHSPADTWHIVTNFQLPRVQGTTVTWDVTGVHDMFRTLSTLQELIRRYIGRPVRIDPDSSLGRGVRATILDAPAQAREEMA
jgi:uracil-DNA glycosylase family protein